MLVVPLSASDEATPRVMVSELTSAWSAGRCAWRRAAARCASRRMCAWWALAAVTSTIWALGMAAPAQAAWHAPVSISAPGDIGPTSLAVNARGDAIAVWTRDVGYSGFWGTYAVEAAFRSAHGLWRRPVRLGMAYEFYGRGAGSDLPVSVALGPRGQAVVVWREADPSSGRELIWAASRGEGGRWQKPIVLSRGGTAPDPEESWPSFGPVQVVLDRRGSATALWTEMGNVLTAVRPAGGPWHKPVIIAPASNNPEMALDAKGDATAAWTHFLSIRRGILVQSAFKAAGGSWSRPVTIGQESSSDYAPPALAVDARGNTVAGWVNTQSHPCTISVRAAFKPAGRRWRQPATLQRFPAAPYNNPGNPGVVCTGPGVVVQVAFAGGRATATWSADSANVDMVQAAFRPAGGPWGRPVTIAAPVSFSSSLQLLGNPRGDGLAVWSVFNSAGAGTVTPDSVQAATTSPQGRWQHPVTLGLGASPDAALDSHGNSVAIWVQDLGSTTTSANLVVRATTFTR